MGTDLESNPTHRTEVSCLDLGRSRDRNLEVINVLVFLLSLYIKNTTPGGVFAVQKLAARIKLENNYSIPLFRSLSVTSVLMLDFGPSKSSTKRGDDWKR